MIVERAYAHLPAGPGPQDGVDRTGWPWSVPCVRQLLDEGLRFTAPVTFLVGENGSGKSTLVEALAEGFGLDSYGGSHDWRYASAREKSALGERIRFDAAPRGRRMATSWAARKGFFLRAETALDALGREGLAPESVSHGEGFLAAFRGSSRRRGSTSWTSRRPRSPSPRASNSSGTSTGWRRRAARSSAPPTPLS